MPRLPFFDTFIRMEENENTTEYESADPIFILETSDPKVVHIELSKTGRETIGDGTDDVIEDLAENIDQNFKSSGYIYNVCVGKDGETIDITPFEDEDDFSQEVFNIIAEELNFMDNLVSDVGDEEGL